MLFPLLFRLLIIVFITLIGFYLDYLDGEFDFYYPITAFIVSFVMVLIELSVRKKEDRHVIYSFLGMLLGLIGATIFSTILYYFFSEMEILSELGYGLILIFQISGMYFGFVIGWFKTEGVQFGKIDFKSTKDKTISNNKILDTSVIIDGRIADIAETGFLEGVLVVPRFVLKELQQVADSSDPLKRSRGRRGLDILNRMKASKNAIIKIVDTDFADIKEVDSKLLKLAGLTDSIIITNDYNLNKVAEFQGVVVLNVNELSNAVKPIVLPNEELRINIIKEGKDEKQGIGYLDDGTMIVVDNGKDRIGQEVDVVVTSILQTPAGRMIFTQLADQKKN